MVFKFFIACRLPLIDVLYYQGLNAFEFEKHAGCKSKHPNNHIYFENGKTIYQIVQELRSTPESSLFDTIQTIFGAPINQKAFRIWKGKEISDLFKHKQTNGCIGNVEFYCLGLFGMSLIPFFL
jgi:ribonuclease I